MEPTPDQPVTNAVGTDEGEETARPDEEAGKESAQLYTLTNVLAHEIRNPLNALLMNLKVLDKRLDDDKSREILSAAVEQAERMNRILSDFLRYARPREPRPSRFKVAEVTDNIRVFVAPQLMEKGTKLDISIPVGSPEVFTDKDMLNQLLLNLILNSIEAAPGGEIHVQVKKEDGFVSLSVRDNGPGFVDLGRAFELFYSTKDDGIGLGLPTVEALASVLGGSVEIKNLAGAGALVEVKLPDREG